mmetsp:Transcript_1357/g.2825  ORF Transcript_1357/g.2825 Transcript_1357/m.2825 type:complete len:207 (+) Transcript_1357:187-807(+)
MGEGQCLQREPGVYVARVPGDVRGVQEGVQGSQHGLSRLDRRRRVLHQPDVHVQDVSILLRRLRRLDVRRQESDAVPRMGGCQRVRAQPARRDEGLPRDVRRVHDELHGSRRGVQGLGVRQAVRRGAGVHVPRLPGLVWDLHRARSQGRALTRLRGQVPLPVCTRFSEIGSYGAEFVTSVNAVARGRAHMHRDAAGTRSCLQSARP